MKSSFFVKVISGVMLAGGCFFLVRHFHPEDSGPVPYEEIHVDAFVSKFKATILKSKELFRRAGECRFCGIKKQEVDSFNKSHLFPLLESAYKIQRLDPEGKISRATFDLVFAYRKSDLLNLPEILSSTYVTAPEEYKNILSALSEDDRSWICTQTLRGMQDQPFPSDDAMMTNLSKACITSL